VDGFKRKFSLYSDPAAFGMDMAATTKAMGKAAGVPIDSLMKDVAGSSKAFAEYGKDGGINIAKAAVAAAKLGVGMDSLTKVTDSLLDFETSINSEMDDCIALSKVRSLLYEAITFFFEFNTDTA
jgi:hypothetical protein